MKILVLTERDDCCGPMAAAFLADFSSKIEVVSAGRHPAPVVPRLLVAVMRECLIDLDGYVPCDAALMNVNDFDAVFDCPDEPCPDEIQACRKLRDFIKNESFLFYRRLLSSVS